MDQVKIGNFLKELRKEKNLTQEQLAEMMNVSSRSVSRWETGSNLPDLEILVLLADYYGVELRELLDGERKLEKTEEVEDTVLKMVEYSKNDTLKVTRRLHWIFVGGCITAILYLVLYVNDYADNFFGGWCLGITFGTTILGAIMTSKYASKIRQYKLQIVKKHIG